MTPICSWPAQGERTRDSIDGQEQCDGTDLGSVTCESLGYGVGLPTCTPDCTLSLSTCEWCGDGVTNGGELCDGQDLAGASCESLGKGYIGGQLGCNASCDGFDESGCWECSSCGDCGGQACADHRCGTCNTTADCCAPLVCFFGTCLLY